MTAALETARRLAAMGVEVRSVELREQAKAEQRFAENGNRAMRRAAKRRKRR